MREVVGDLWELPADWRCITTNGDVKRNGACVMGRGCAREARDRFPGFDKILGFKLQHLGNHLILHTPQQLITFPVKHHWDEPADLDLISRSARELAFVARELHWQTFLLPRPGCGNGGLRWEAVKVWLERAELPDNVIVVTKFVATVGWAAGQRRQVSPGAGRTTAAAPLVGQRESPVAPRPRRRGGLPG